MAGGLAGMLLVAACAHKQPAKVAPAAPPVVTKPAPAPAPVPVIAAAPAAVYAFYKIFGLDTNSAVGVGNF